MLQWLPAAHRLTNNFGRSILQILPSGGTAELARYHQKNRAYEEDSYFLLMVIATHRIWPSWSFIRWL